MRRRFILLFVMLCTLAMALPIVTCADSTVSGELTCEVNITKTDDTHIQFGFYPQTEVVSKASQSGVYGKSWKADGDYVIDDDLYSNLQAASYDSNGDTIINGTKYRRILKSDATYSESGSDNYYNWSDSTTYHYFRYDPIKWRILSSNGGKVFLMTESVLDTQEYNNTYQSGAWEKSAVRSWLNGYSANENSCGIDYSGKNFINTAFNTKEQALIKTTYVANPDSIYFIRAKGGNDTKDKIFLLSETEVSGTEGTSYGFTSDYSTYDSKRSAKGSTFAKAMGLYNNTFSSLKGECYWWLLLGGEYINDFSRVEYGNYDSNGLYVNFNSIGIRPVVNLSLEPADSSNYIGTLKMADMTIDNMRCSYDGTKKEPAITIDGLTEGTDFTVEYSNNVNAGTATVTVTGKDNCTGTLTKTFTINPMDISGLTADMEYERARYDGTAKEPAVTIEGLAEGTDFEVEYKDNIDVGTATVIIKGIGNYTGTIEKTFDIVWINPTKITSKNTKISLDATKLTYDGTAKEPVVKTVKVRISKKKTVKLTEGKDFTIKYSSNVNAVKKAKVTITGKGRYKGSVSRTFTIAKAKQTVTAEPSEQTVYVNDKCSITSATNGNGKLAYTSSDKKKATVSSAGTITAKKAGTVKISAYAKATTNYSKSNTVKLTLKIIKRDQSMTAEAPHKLIFKGETMKITTENAIGKLTYKTSNSKIATVSSKGTIKGIKPGTATITVTAAGNGEYNKAVQTIDITVE